ncbi:MAG TPA: EI24 domain-containing protein [Sulfurovum sp.]|uniref:EI24 domain-containing protein n=1 Tax=Sulfurovum sp. TaxID=1969726 RepID=UPI002F946DE6
MHQIITKSIQDILSINVILFVLKMGVLSLILTLLMTWGLWEPINTFLSSYLSWIPWDWVQTTGASVAALIFAYMLFIITVSLLTSLYSEKLLIALAQKHYPDVPVVGSAKIGTSLMLTLKASIIFLLLFILTLPLLFVPVLGQVVVLYLWSVLLKEPTVYDVGSLFMDDRKRLKEKKKRTGLLAMVASLFNYVPLVNIFAPVFAQILFLHHMLGEKK